jgi:hypothetical protein
MRDREIHRDHDREENQEGEGVEKHFAGMNLKTLTTLRKFSESSRLLAACNQQPALAAGD